MNSRLPRRNALALCGLLLSAPLFSAEPSIEGKWVWRKMDYVRTPPFEKFPVQTDFEFHKQGNLYTGHISGGRPQMDEALREIRLEASHLTFLTGKPGGGGADLLTRWSGTQKGDTIQGTYTFVESGSSGNFEMTRSR
jgi:hypothetical protein